MFKKKQPHTRPRVLKNRLVGIAGDEHGFVMVIARYKKPICEFTVYLSRFLPNGLPEAAHGRIAANNLPWRYPLKKAPIHAVSEHFEVLPLLLPAGISEAEAIACAELKVKQQANPDAWLWDIQLAEQNSKLWLLAKSRYTELVAWLNTLTFCARQLASWCPASEIFTERQLVEHSLIKQPQIEAWLSEHFPHYTQEEYRKLVLAIAVLYAKYQQIKHTEIRLVPHVQGGFGG